MKKKIICINNQEYWLGKANKLTKLRLIKKQLIKKIQSPAVLQIVFNKIWSCPKV